MKLTAEQIAEGWILNNGTNPIKDGQRYEVRYLDGTLKKSNLDLISWDLYSCNPVISYRILSETPTIEQVKEHFKDALIVESFWEGKVFSTFNNFHFWNGEAYCSDEEGKDRLMWGKKHGYANILEYKKTETKNVKIGITPIEEWAEKTTLDLQNDYEKEMDSVRLGYIKEALTSAICANLSIPTEWITEYNNLIKK